MTKELKSTARTKIIEAIRALPTRKAREMWAKKLGKVLLEMNR